MLFVKQERMFCGTIKCSNEKGSFWVVILLFLSTLRLAIPPILGRLSRALLTGNLNLAVELCLEQERFADAIILAIQAGPEMLQETQRV
jgi:hypothetical protein